MTKPKKDIIDKFIEDEVDRIEENFHLHYRTRWSIRNMVRRGLVRLIKRIDKYNG